MSSWANLLIVSGGRYDLSHYNGGTGVLYDDLFWGPARAEAFIRATRPVDPSDWMGETASEGGAVLDLDRRVLCWFGGEDIKYDVCLRRLYLRVMAQLWPG
jgi:hypothetical protein